MSNGSIASSLAADWGREEFPERIGPFRVVGILGRGGMGVVFDATTHDGQRVALKVIRPQGDVETAQLLVARFLREAKILGELNHPCVVRLVDSGEVDGILYLAMDRIEGVSLLTIRRRGPLGFDALLQLGIQLADALQHLHEGGVVHRDIKPANILIDSGGRPVITDFGISGMSEATGITRMGDLLGSPGFMAPEVTEGHPPTELSDQFALGRLLYELGATGPAKRLPKNVPLMDILAASLEIDWNRFPKDDRWPGMEKVLRRMVATNPRERFPSAADARLAMLALQTSDLLDVDTLSEHIGRLNVQPRMSWDLGNSGPEGWIQVMEPKVEEPAAPSRPTPAYSSPPPNRRPGSVRVDHDALFNDKTALDPAHLAQHAYDLPAARVEDLTDPPPDFASSREKTNTDTNDRTADLPPRKYGPSDTLPAPMPLSAIAAMDQAKSEVATASDFDAYFKNNDDFAAAARALAEPLMADPVPPANITPAAPAPMPLYRFERKRELEPEEGSRPETPEAQIARLQIQLQKLRDQLAQSKRDLQARPTPNVWLVTAVVTLIAATFGFAGATLLFRGTGSPAPIVIVAPKGGEAARPAAKYTAEGNPSVKDLSNARALFDAASEHLSKRDLVGAEALLKQCIATADLAECHRALGSLLALTNNPASRAHFEHYLRVSPGAPDAEAIRRILDNP